MSSEEKINQMSEDIDFIKKTIVKMSRLTEKRLRRIDVARKLNITEETVDNWRNNPDKNFPIRGVDGKWSETDIDNWLANK
jgi:predicted DNA-binding transcriptional regulator AlpA